MCGRPVQACDLVDRGPPADSGRAAAAFRKLWGEKAEMRRFPDGAIHEAVAWDHVSPDRRITIPEQIGIYILEHHFSGMQARSRRHPNRSRLFSPIWRPLCSWPARLDLSGGCTDRTRAGAPCCGAGSARVPWWARAGPRLLSHAGRRLSWGQRCVCRAHEATRRCRGQRDQAPACHDGALARRCVCPAVWVRRAPHGLLPPSATPAPAVGRRRRACAWREARATAATVCGGHTSAGA
jgi:Nrap protein domain 3